MPTKRRRRAPAAPKPIRPAAGEQLFVLDVDFEMRAVAAAAGAKWDPARRAHIYVGASLPPALEPFRPARFSWPARLEHLINGTNPAPVGPTDPDFQPRDYQLEAVEAAQQARHRGLPGFLMADDTGLGKTPETIWSIHDLPAELDEVLIVCPKSVIPGWRQTIAALGTQQRTWTIINYESLAKLVDVPKAAAQAKKTKTRNKHVAQSGKPILPFDVVVFDEAHRLRNPTAQQTTLARRLSASARFAIWCSATAGQSPLELSYLAPLLGAVTGHPVEDLEAFEQWCTEIGLSVTRGDYGRALWDRNDADLQLMQRLLFKPYSPGKAPAGIRRLPTDIHGWPERTRILHPVDLDANSRRLYDLAWTEFRAALQLAENGGDPSNGLAAQTRFRQQASLLRVPGIVDHIATLLDEGRQVVVSLQWLETLDALHEAVDGKKFNGKTVHVAEIHGDQTPAEREAERLRFQAGDAQVVLTTVTEGINLHQSEKNANGVPRATIAADVRWSSVSMHQLEGRADRSGDHAPVFWCFAVDTIEEKVVRRAAERMVSMAAMQGDDTAELEALLAHEALKAVE